MNTLSLFDGMSGGQQTLNKLGIKIDKYFASEIDKYAIQISQKNYPDTIQLGSVTDVNTNKLPKIDLLIGGSPCQSFSFAGKRNGMTVKGGEEILTLDKYLQCKAEGFEFEGQSYLFWEYVRILKEVKPKYFFLENVMMSEKWEKAITKVIGVKPICINSALVSAQNRKRLYWTNIGLEIDNTDLFGGMKSIIPQPQDKGILLKDILEKNVDEKYNLSKKMLSCFDNHKKQQQLKGNCFGFEPSNGNKKANSLTTRNGSRPDDNYIIEGCDYRKDEGFRIRAGGKTGTLAARARTDESCGQLVKIETNIRKLTPIECERLQGFPDDYTKGVSNSQRYKMLGNGWQVDTIKHIFKYLN